MVYAVHRSSSAYIRAAVSSSSKFEQSGGTDHPASSSIAKVWSVKSCLLCQDSSKLSCIRRYVTRSVPLEPTCNAAAFFLLPSVSCNFYFESHVNQTVNSLRTRVELTETEDL